MTKPTKEDAPKFLPFSSSHAGAMTLNVNVGERHRLGGAPHPVKSGIKGIEKNSYHPL